MTTDNKTPGRVSVRVYQWAHDVNGNPTAHFAIRGGNYVMYSTKRRRQVGYADKVSGGAVAYMESRYPGTRWTVDEKTAIGGRSEGFAEFDLIREGLE